MNSTYILTLKCEILPIGADPVDVQLAATVPVCKSAVNRQPGFHWETRRAGVSAKYIYIYICLLLKHTLGKKGNLTATSILECKVIIKCESEA